MKNTLRACALGFVLSLGAQAFGAQTHAQLIQNREQAIADWNRVLSLLKKAGVKEDEPVYKRVHKALKANETHLKALTSGTHRGTAGKVAGAAAGAGLLDKVGGWFGGASKAPQKEPVKVGGAKRVHAAPKKAQQPAKRRKTQQSGTAKRVKAPAKK